MGSQDRCMKCDRVDCLRAEPPTQAQTAALRRAIDNKGDVSEADRATIESRVEDVRRADDDCWRHRVDWRARCLAAEAERDATRPVVEAAIREVTELASTNYNDARKDLGEAAVRTLTAFIRLSDAVDAYRAKEKT